MIKLEVMKDMVFAFRRSEINKAEKAFHEVHDKCVNSIETDNVDWSLSNKLGNFRYKIDNCWSELILIDIFNPNLTIEDLEAIANKISDLSNTISKVMIEIEILEK